MKHLIFLILLVFASCSGDKGSVFTVPADDSNNNTSKNGNGGTNIFDDIIPSANAGVIESENGCIDGFSKFTVYSNTESYHSCISSTPLSFTPIYSFSDGQYYSTTTFSKCYRQYGMSTCRWEQLKSASVQGVINLNSTSFVASDVFTPAGSAADYDYLYVLSLTDDFPVGYLKQTTDDVSITSAQEYCCYR